MTRAICAASASVRSSARASVVERKVKSLDRWASCYRGANNSCGHVGSLLDAEMPERAIWPAQVACGGLAWTRQFS